MTHSHQSQLPLDPQSCTSPLAVEGLICTFSRLWQGRGLDRETWKFRTQGALEVPDSARPQALAATQALERQAVARKVNRYHAQRRLREQKSGSRL
jgi:hypothetical protein